MNSAESQSASERAVRLEQLLDRQDIIDCITRVSRGIDRFDRQLFLSAYHRNAVIDAGGLVGDPASVYDAGAALHESGQISTLHHLTNHSCEIEGDVAHTETYFLYVGRNRDGTNWAAGGRYVDRLERRDGAWKIALRCTVMDWSGMISATEVPLFENVPDLHLNGVPSRSRDDLSYLRPLVNRREMHLPADPRKLSLPRS